MKELSDILIKRCDNWACSESFYNSLIGYRHEKVLQAMNYFVHRKKFSDERVEFNLFGGIEGSDN